SLTVFLSRFRFHSVQIFGAGLLRSAFGLLMVFHTSLAEHVSDSSVQTASLVPRVHRAVMQPLIHFFESGLRRFGRVGRTTRFSERRAAVHFRALVAIGVHSYSRRR